MFSWIEEKMSAEAKELFNLLFTKDYDSSALRKTLDTGRFSPDDVNRAAIDYVQYCMDFRHGDHYNGEERHYGATIPGYEDSHVVDALEVLLDYGLDPNKKYVEKNDDGSDNTGRYDLAVAMVSCLDTNSAGFNDSLYYDASAVKPDVYREVFKDIFYSLGQDEHYEMMKSRAV